MAKRDVCMQLSFQTPLMLKSSQPDHGLHISTGKWLVPGKEEEGREQEVIHLVSRDLPQKENQPSTSLAFQSTQSPVLTAPPTLDGKQDMCTLNLTGALELCCAHFLYTLNPGTGLK